MAISRKTGTSPVVLRGGPFANGKVYLSHDDAGTFTFKTGRYIGRYTRTGKWQEEPTTKPEPFQFEFRENLNGLSNGLVK